MNFSPDIIKILCFRSFRDKMLLLAFDHRGRILCGSSPFKCQANVKYPQGEMFCIDENQPLMVLKNSKADLTLKIA